MKDAEGGLLGKAIFKVWQEDTARELRIRALQELEEKRRRETGELNSQLKQERHRILSLEATADRLRANLKAAAQRMLMKVMSTTQKPWADGHALQAWTGAHPAIKLQNQLDRTCQELSETHAKLTDAEAKLVSFGTDLEETQATLAQAEFDRDALATNYATIMAELQKLTGSRDSHAGEIQKMAEAKAKEARDALIAEVNAANELVKDQMNQDFAKERIRFEDQIGGLEAQLESIKRGLGGSAADADEDSRVVPKGQGVLCCGCLRQIVNRGVKQLPPVNSKTKGKSPSRKEEDKLKKLFFQEELLGQPDPDDLIHSEVWKARRDPMKGMRYTAVSAEASWPSTKSASCSRLSPLRLKQDKIFQPSAFR